MKYFDSASVIGDVQFFLAVLFGCLIYISPFFAIPCLAFLGAWLFERNKIDIDISASEARLEAAKKAYEDGLVNILEQKSVIAGLKDEMSQLKTAHSMRMGGR